MEKKIVKSWQDADRLMRMGYICLGVDRNVHDRKQLIFWFEDTPELRMELQKMLDSRRKNK